MTKNPNSEDNSNAYKFALDKWDDLRFPADGLLFLGLGADPAKSAFVGGIFMPHFAIASQENLYFAGQLPHTYKEGTDLKPHVHWAPTNTNTGNVIWELEYSWTNHGDTFTTTTIQSTDPGDGTADKHQVATFSAISGTGMLISSMIIGRISRRGDLDNYNALAVLLELDFHYQKDSIGSVQEYYKY